MTNLKIQNGFFISITLLGCAASPWQGGLPTSKVEGMSAEERKSEFAKFSILKITDTQIDFLMEPQKVSTQSFTQALKTLSPKSIESLESGSTLKLWSRISLAIGLGLFLPENGNKILLRSAGGTLIAASGYLYLASEYQWLVAHRTYTTDLGSRYLGDGMGFQWKLN